MFQGVSAKNKEENQGFFSPSIFPKTRKGELTTQQIVLIIILIASFIILLYFLFRINPGETNSKQICYNSVLLSSKGEGLIGSLDCTTNSVCVSGGDSCEQFNPTFTAKVDPSKKEEVLKVLADEMADCWWMFGEGKLDYVSINVVEEAEEILDESAPYHCAICSRIKFDKKIQNTLKEITYSDLYNYLKTHQSTHDSSSTYLRYLYAVNSLESSNNPVKEFDLNALPISTDAEYLIITGQDPEGWGDEYKRAQIVKTSEVSNVMCGAFDITKAQ